MAQDIDHKFGRFYADHVIQVRRYVARLMPGSPEIEEVAQDAFANVLQAHQAGRDVVHQSYVYTAAKNLVRNIYRRDNIRREPENAADLIEQRASGDPDSERQIIAKERVDLLRQAFATLSPLQQEIILMRKLDNLRIKDIADLKGLSVSLVEKQIRYGLRACQAFLDEQEDASGIDRALQVEGQTSGG